MNKPQAPKNLDLTPRWGRGDVVLVILVVALLAALFFMSACHDDTHVTVMQPGSVLCAPCNGNGPLKHIDLPFDIEEFRNESICVDTADVPFVKCWYGCGDMGSINDGTCVDRGL